MKRRVLTPGKLCGFTLIEVIITLTIFVLLTASVFGIMTAVFASSNDLKANQNRRDEVSALREYLKNNFGNLSSANRLISYRRGDGDGMAINGIILSSGSSMKAIDATPQDNGLYRLRLGTPTDFDPTPSFDSFSQELERNQSALAWVSLMRDVHGISWKFRTIDGTDWQTEWTDTEKMPDLIECSIQIAGDNLPTVMDFQIPHLAPPASENSQAANVNAP